jgi:very-short-patch-repair endonuclease
MTNAASRLNKLIRFDENVSGCFRSAYSMKSVLPIIFFLVVAALIFLFVYYTLIRGRRRKVEQPFSYKSRQRLFTPAETTFLYALEKAVGGDYRIFGKVRLADVVDTEVFRGVGDKAFSLIAYKHVDFLLCDKSDSTIVCAIELDDRTHLSEKRRTKDAEKEHALNSAAVPLVRFPVNSSYVLNEVKSRIMGEIGRREISRRSQDLTCPECGGDVVARLAKAGVHRGKFFVGCSNFPDCKFIEN